MFDKEGLRRRVHQVPPPIPGVISISSELEKGWKQILVGQMEVWRVSEGHCLTLVTTIEVAGRPLCVQTLLVCLCPEAHTSVVPMHTFGLTE